MPGIMLSAFQGLLPFVLKTVLGGSYFIITLFYKCEVKAWGHYKTLPWPH